MAFWDGDRWVPQPAKVATRVSRRRWRDWIATGVIVVGVMGVALPLTGARASAPSLSLRPSSAVAGAVVTARGDGFSRGAQVQLTIDGLPNPLASTRVNGNGSFLARVTVPQVAPGRYTMVAMQVPLSPTRTSTASALVASALLVVAVSSPTIGAPNPSPPATEPAPSPTSTPSPSATPTPAPSQAPSSPATQTPLPTPFPTPVPTDNPQPTAVPAPTAAPPAPAPNPPVSGFVVRNGTGLTVNGAPYRFTGFNVYNANSRSNCWYPMTNGRFGQTLDQIGSGQEAVRVWFFQRLATTNGARDWAAFDATLAAARARGVRVVVTLADHWGACEFNGTKTEGWYSSGYKTSVTSGETTTYREFVREVVSRYRGDPTVLMWQLVNEAETPRAGGGCAGRDVLRNFAADMGSLVKSIDANHLLSLGTIGSGQCGAAGADYQYVHSVPQIDICEYHDYGEPTRAIPGDAYNGLSVRLAQCAALGKPLFVGEMGISRAEVGGSLPARATYLDAKIRAQLAAGVVGVLVWNWNDAATYAPGDYDVAPSDPSIAVVRGY